MDRSDLIAFAWSVPMRNLAVSVGLALATQETEKRNRRDEDAERARLWAARVEKLEKNHELLRVVTAMGATAGEVRSVIDGGRHGLSADQLAAWESWASAHADGPGPVRSKQVRRHPMPPT